MSELLAPDELARLTGKKTRAAQLRELRSMNIPVIERPTHLIVSRVLMREAMKSSCEKAAPENGGIDWSAVK